MIVDGACSWTGVCRMSWIELCSVLCSLLVVDVHTSSCLESQFMHICEATCLAMCKIRALRLYACRMGQLQAFGSKSKTSLSSCAREDDKQDALGAHSCCLLGSDTLRVESNRGIRVRCPAQHSQIREEVQSNYGSFFEDWSPTWVTGPKFRAQDTIRGKGVLSSHGSLS